MSAWLSALGARILEWLISSWLSKLTDWWNDKQAQEKQKKINEANLDTYKKAIEEKKSYEDIAKAGENLLNGIDPSSH